MGKAYTPTIASSNTSSPVRNISMSLNGQSPLSTFGSGHSPSNMHTNNGPQAFNTPTHGATLLGGANGAHIQNKETRTNGVPHTSWMP